MTRDEAQGGLVDKTERARRRRRTHSIVTWVMDKGVTTYSRRIGQGDFPYSWGGVAHLALCGVYYIPWQHS
jgi:hypothetical protein